MHHYLLPLQQVFETNKHQENALAMEKYVRNKFLYYGIKAPERHLIVKDFIQKQGLPALNEVETVVRDCWQQPQREFQYFGMEVLEKFIKKSDETIIPLLEHMVVQKSWWDTVDFIATHLVGKFFIKYPAGIPSKTEEWIHGDNMWLQRICLLFQLKYKEQTDFVLLTYFITQCHTSKEFFIQKAIGWALREYSKRYPDVVIDFIKKHNLASLSNREALKWVNRNRK